jgi:hypothetical protein
LGVGYEDDLIHVIEARWPDPSWGCLTRHQFKRLLRGMGQQESRLAVEQLLENAADDKPTEHDLIRAATGEPPRNIRPGGSAQIVAEAPATSMSDETSVTDEISRLWVLRNQGVITDAEFRTKEARLLAQMPAAPRPREPENWAMLLLVFLTMGFPILGLVTAVIGWQRAKTMAGKALCGVAIAEGVFWTGIVLLFFVLGGLFDT